MTGYELKMQRSTAGVTGDALCKRASISRTKLSNVERGYLILTQEESEKLHKALDEIVAGRKQLIELAAALGFTEVNTLRVH
jgi:transcriptional regulator with XRE-family HTH domain